MSAPGALSVPFRRPGVSGVGSTFRMTKTDEPHRHSSPDAPPHTAPDAPPDAPAPPGREQLRTLVDEVDRANRAIAAATAGRAKAIDRLRVFSEAAAVVDPHDTSADHGWPPEVCAERELYQELSGVLAVSENTARTIVYESKLLVHQLPATIGALHDGSISSGHARVIVDHAASVPPDRVGEFEAALVSAATDVGVPRLRALAKRLLEAMHPRSIDERRVEAADRRTVWIEPGDDGMATIGAVVGAELAHGMIDCLTEIARQQGRSDRRTMAQRRADAFADLLLTGDTCAATTDAAGSGRASVAHGIVPKVLVTVPVLTLLGHSDTPGILDGYGPIDAATARELAAHAPTFTRLLTHPVSSAILDLDRTTYAVPADLKLAVRLRDGTCRAIGCSHPARHSDLDHTTEWRDDGTTAIDNLACLCETHHTMKTHTRVRMEHLPGGDIRWTMPSGRTYVTHPATRVDALYPGGTEPGRTEPGGTEPGGTEPGGDPGEKHGRAA